MGGLTRLFGSGLDALWSDPEPPSPEMTDKLRQQLEQEKAQRDAQEQVDQNQPSLSSVFTGGLGNALSAAKNAYFPDLDPIEKQHRMNIINQEAKPWQDPENVNKANRGILDIMGGNVKHVLDTVVGTQADQGNLGNLVDPSQGNESGQALFNVAQNVFGGRMSPEAIKQTPFLKEAAASTGNASGTMGYAGLANKLLRGGQTVGEDVGGMALDPSMYNPSRMVQGLQSGQMLRGLVDQIGKGDFSPEGLAHLLPLIAGAAHFGKGALEGREGGNSLQQEKLGNLAPVEGQKNSPVTTEPGILPGFPDIPPGADLSHMPPLDIPFAPENDMSKLVNINDVHNPDGELNAGFDFGEVKDKLKNLGPIPEPRQDSSDFWNELNNKIKSEPEPLPNLGDIRDQLFQKNKAKISADALAGLKNHPASRAELSDLEDIHGTSNPVLASDKGYFHRFFTTDNPEKGIRASNKEFGPSDTAVDWPKSPDIIQPYETRNVKDSSGKTIKQIDVVPVVKSEGLVTPELEEGLRQRLEKQGLILTDPHGSGGNLGVRTNPKTGLKEAFVIDPGAVVPREVAKNYKNASGKTTPEAIAARQAMQDHVRRAGFDFGEGEEKTPGYSSNADEVMKDLEESGLGDIVPSELSSRQKRTLEGTQGLNQNRKPIKVDQLFDPETGEDLSGGEKLPDLAPLDMNKSNEELVSESLKRIKNEPVTSTQTSTPLPVSKTSALLDNDLTTESGSGRKPGRPSKENPFGNKPPGKPPSSSEPPSGQPPKKQMTEKSDLLQKLADVSSGLKRSIMSVGIPGTGISPHGISEIARAGLGSDFGKDTPKAIKYAIKPSEAVKSLERNKSQIERLTGGTKENPTSGLLKISAIEGTGEVDPNASKVWKTVREAHRSMFEKPLFEKMIPALKVEKALELEAYYKRKGIKPEEALQRATKDANNLFGGLDTEGRSTTTKQIAQVTLFAPDWLESQGRIAKGAAEGLLNPKDPRGKMYRNIMLNYAALTGVKYAADLAIGSKRNEKDLGHSLDVKVGDTEKNESGKTKSRYVRPEGNAGDFIRFPIDVAEAIQNDPGKLPQIIESRMAPLARAVSHVVLNRDSFGNPLYGKDKYGKPIDSSKAIGNLMTETIGNVTPAIVKSVLDYSKGKSSPEEIGMKAVGLPVSYVTEKESGTKTTKTVKKKKSGTAYPSLF
jgi:hypothetical protein